MGLRLIGKLCSHWSVAQTNKTCSSSCWNPEVQISSQAHLIALQMQWQIWCLLQSEISILHRLYTKSTKYNAEDTIHTLLNLWSFLKHSATLEHSGMNKLSSSQALNLLILSSTLNQFWSTLKVSEALLNSQTCEWALQPPSFRSSQALLNSETIKLSSTTKFQKLSSSLKLSNSQALFKHQVSEDLKLSSTPTLSSFKFLNVAMLATIQPCSLNAFNSARANTTKITTF